MIFGPRRVFLFAATANEESVPCTRNPVSTLYRWHEPSHPFSVARRCKYLTEPRCHSGLRSIRIFPRGVTMATRRGPGASVQSPTSAPAADRNFASAVCVGSKSFIRTPEVQGTSGPRPWDGGSVGSSHRLSQHWPSHHAASLPASSTEQCTQRLHPRVAAHRSQHSAAVAALRAGSFATTTSPQYSTLRSPTPHRGGGAPRRADASGTGGAVARAPVSDARRSRTDTRCRESRWWSNERCDPWWCAPTRARAARVDTSRVAIGSPMWLWSKSWITARCSAACARATYAEHPTSATTPTSAPSRRHVAERCPRGVRERAMATWECDEGRYIACRPRCLRARCML